MIINLKLCLQSIGTILVTSHADSENVPPYIFVNLPMMETDIMNYYCEILHYKKHH